MTVASRRVLIDGHLVPGTLELRESHIAAIRAGIDPGAWDFGDRLILPGIIDIHGDAFERQWMPRPRVFFPAEMALLETDRQLLANGITTAFHGLTVSWEPGLRGVEHGRQMFEALRHIEGQLRCDTRLHLRFEIYAFGEAPELIRWVEAGRVDLIAFNDHLEMVAAHLDDENKAGKYAERSGLSVEGFRQLLGQTRARSGEVRGVIEQLAAAGRACQIPMASHDDETPEMREFYQSLGSTICEFPVDELTARSAIERGSEVVMGGPNVVRGGSHTKRMTAMDAIRGGYCTVLASDYYYPSLLHAAFRVAGAGAASLAEAWQLVSENPARAAGLNDRGQLAPGKRADLAVVDDTHPAHPRVAATFTGGRAVYCAEPALVGKIHEPVFG